MAVPTQMTPQTTKLQPAVGASHQTPPASVQEFSIRVPKNSRKKFSMMRFNSNLNVDFTKWSQVKMERENNMKEFRSIDEEMPKFGAGSEFGREAREEARRKKFGIITKKYKPDEQPWILKVGGKTGKKFKGIREGGVSENAGYYVFMNAEDGIIEAYPLQEWYNFQPIQRYKALSAEEAEEEFGRRNKQQNYFSLMMRKRLRPDEDQDLDDPDETKGKKKGGGGQKTKDLKISDMEEWMDSDDESDSDDNDEKDDDREEKKNKNKKSKKEEEAKKKKKDSDDEAFEESDDGDEEGRELDYISDSSVSVSDHDEKAKDELKGVAEEDALRKLLTSDEDEDENEQKKEGEDGEEDEEKKKDEAEAPEAGDSSKKKGAANDKEKKKKLKKKKDSGRPSSPSTSAPSKSSDKKEVKKEPTKESDLSDSSDSEAGKTLLKETNSGGSSRSASPSLMDLKRKATSNLLGAVSKKVRLESPLSGSNDFGITEDAVRRYLMRKPMTTTELLQKFKSKKTGLSSEQLVNIMTGILKRINPVRQTIKGKMYLSIKAPHMSRPAD